MIPVVVILITLWIIGACAPSPTPTAETSAEAAPTPTPTAETAAEASVATAIPTLTAEEALPRIPHLAQTSDAVNRQLSCFSSRYMNLLAVFQI